MYIYIQFIVIIMLQSLFFFTLPYVLISNLITFYNYSFKFVNIDNFVELCTCGWKLCFRKSLYEIKSIIILISLSLNYSFHSKIAQCTSIGYFYEIYKPNYNLNLTVLTWIQSCTLRKPTSACVLAHPSFLWCGHPSFGLRPQQNINICLPYFSNVPNPIRPAASLPILLVPLRI